MNDHDDYGYPEPYLTEQVEEREKVIKERGNDYEKKPHSRFFNANL
jgi:hypothetical protein